MVHRALGITCAAIALALLLGGTAVTAGEKTKTAEGKIVSVKDNKLTLEAKDGKDYTHTVATTAKVTCDGKECKLGDLKSGIMARVTLDTASNQVTNIEARTKEK
jgi:hypothetical protein